MQRAWQSITKLWRAETWLLFCVLAISTLLITFGLVASEVVEGSTQAFDRQVILAFRSAGDPAVPIGPPWVQEMARDITALGSLVVLGIVLFVVVGYLLLVRQRAAAWLMLSAGLGGVAMNFLLKQVFARPRPDFVVPAARVFSPSFPSGHAVLSAIAYLTLAALLARTTRSPRLRIYLVATGIVLTLSVGVSRVYLGVHYPTDVLAGWCVGSAWALTCWTIMTRLQHRGRVESPEAC